MRAGYLCYEEELFNFERLFYLQMLGLAGDVALVLLASVPQPLANYPEAESARQG